MAVRPGSESMSAALLCHHVLLPLLLLVCAIGGRLGHDIGQKLQVLHSGDGVRHVAVLDVSAGLPLALDDVVALLDEVLEEHLCCDGDDEGSVVAAVADVVVGGDDLLHSGDYEDVSGGVLEGGSGTYAVRRRCR